MPRALVAQWRRQLALHQMARDTQLNVIFVVRKQAIIPPREVCVPQLFGSVDLARLIGAQVLRQARRDVHRQHEDAPITDRQSRIVSQLLLEPVHLLRRILAMTDAHLVLRIPRKTVERQDTELPKQVFPVVAAF